MKNSSQLVLSSSLLSRSPHIGYGRANYLDGYGDHRTNCSRISGWCRTQLIMQLRTLIMKMAAQQF